MNAQHLPRVELFIYGPYGDLYVMPRCFAMNAENEHCRNRSSWVSWYTGEPYQFLCTHHRYQQEEWCDGGTPVHIYAPEEGE